MTEPQFQPPPHRPTWMLVVFGIACFIVLVNAGIYLYGLTLPDSWSVSESILIDATPAEIATYIEDPDAWTRWSMWSDENDPTLKTKSSGPDSGPKATLGWIGRGLGSGKLVITDVSATESDSAGRVIRYELHRQGELFSDNGQFVLTDKDGQTEVVWSDSGEIGSTLGRVFFRERFIETISRDYAQCLEQLKTLVENDTESTSPEAPPPP